MKARMLTSRTAILSTVAGAVVLSASGFVAHAVTAETPPPTVTAKGAVLVDGKSGESLFGKTADTARPMASTAKLMVASVVLDQKGLDLDRKVPVEQEYRDYVTENHTSTADLQTGDKLSIRQLLYAALLPSGADAAYALADTFGEGDNPEQRAQSFIGDMNEKADELGLDKTTYKSFDGSSADTTSSPADIAKLARHAMENNTFRTVVKTKEYKGEAPAANGRTRYYTWANTNQLLTKYDGAIGIKTGTTSKAGKCLVFAAERDGKTLVGTVLNGTDRYTDAAKMLDYGFGEDPADTKKISEAKSSEVNHD